MAMDLSKCTVLVTGGARGIGLELSRQLVAKGCHVIAVGRNTLDLEDLRRQFPDAITTFSADLSLKTDVDALVGRLVDEHPEMNILINNAGIQTEMNLFSSNAAEITLQARQEIAVNFDALIGLTVGMLPVLKLHKHAAIINISSGLALAPKAASPVYSATKAAVRSFTKALRYQCADHAPQIKVSEAIMPLVDTEMTQGRGTQKISPQQAAQEIIVGLQKKIPEIWIAKTKLLRLINRVSPRLAERILR